MDNIQEEIVASGILLFQNMYGDGNRSLKELRLSKYNKMTVTNTLKPEYITHFELTFNTMIGFC